MLQTATGAIAVDGIEPLTFLLFMREASRSGILFLLRWRKDALANWLWGNVLWF
jgi:hypothetical protein